MAGSFALRSVYRKASIIVRNNKKYLFPLIYTLHAFSISRQWGQIKLIADTKRFSDNLIQF